MEKYCVYLHQLEIKKRTHSLLKVKPKPLILGTSESCSWVSLLPAKPGYIECGRIPGTNGGSDPAKTLQVLPGLEWIH